MNFYLSPLAVQNITTPLLPYTESVDELTSDKSF